MFVGVEWKGKGNLQSIPFNTGSMLGKSSESASLAHMDQATFPTRMCKGGWRLPLHKECSGNTVRAGGLESPSTPSSDSPARGRKQQALLHVRNLDNRDGIFPPESITGLEQDWEGREAPWKRSRKSTDGKEHRKGEEEGTLIPPRVRDIVNT